MLSIEFLNNLHEGWLRPLTVECQSDNTLFMAIRNDCINIYYRGGNLVQIRRSNQSYFASFDKMYLKDEGPGATRGHNIIIEQLPKTLTDGKSVELWVKAFPSLKYVMDLWFNKHRREERELQQHMVRENNRMGNANMTDYFIVDIEFGSNAADVRQRVDMVAIYWPSTGQSRRSNKDLRLVFIEIKHGDRQLRDAAGLVDHLVKADVLARRENLQDLMDTVQIRANQLKDLGLLPIKRHVNFPAIPNDKSIKTEMILALSGHDPASRILLEELANLPVCTNLDVKFMVANFTGYGIYRENTFSLEELRNRLNNQIYNGE